MLHRECVWGPGVGTTYGEDEIWLWKVQFTTVLDLSSQRNDGILYIDHIGALFSPFRQWDSHIHSRGNSHVSYYYSAQP